MRGWGCVVGGVQGGHAWQGACVAAGVCGEGGCVWQERRPLQRTVRILLECILVRNSLTIIAKGCKKKKGSPNTSAAPAKE